MFVIVTKFVDTNQCDNVLREYNYNVIKWNHAHINKTFVLNNTYLRDYSISIKHWTSEGQSNEQSN